MTTIGLIDHEVQIRHNLRDLLNQDGYKVRTVADRFYRFDTIVRAVDLIMCPIALGSDYSYGAKLLKSCNRRANGPIPTILFYAHLDDAAAIERLGLRGATYLDRNTPYVELLALVRRLTTPV